MRVRCVHLLLVFSIIRFAHASEAPIDVYIRDDVLEDYQAFVAGRDVLSISSSQSTTLRRDVADMVLLQQALALGGFHRTFRYLPGKFNFRNTRMLETGDLLLSFDTYWLTDATRLGNKVFITEPVIRRGEYLAAVFTSPNNAKALALREPQQLSELTAVSTPKWHTDWSTLSKIPLKKLIREDEWLSQARMVHIQWVDFMLMPFSNLPSGQYQLEQLRLQQVPGVAVLLNDSRHFVVSQAHPEGRAAFAALNKGLKVLRESGRLEKLYRDAGFLVDPAKYRILNPVLEPLPKSN